MRQFRWYIAVSSLWALAQLFLPADLAGYWYLLGAICALVVIWRRTRTVPSEVRTPAVLITIAGTSSLIGVVVRSVYGMAVGSDFPFPSPGDVFALASYPFVLAAILVVVYRRLGRFDLDLFLDALVAGAAVLIIQWTVILLPFVQDPGFSPFAKFVQLVYSMLGLLVFIAAVMTLVAGGQRSVSNRLLAVALIATFVMDNFGTFLTATGRDEGMILYLAPLIYVFGGSGLIHPSIAELTSRPTDQGALKRLSTKRIAVMAAALIGPPALILSYTLAESYDQLLLPAAGSLALAPLVVVRLARLVQDRERLAAQEAALRSVGERLVAAETQDDVTRIITVGTEQLLGANFVDGGLVLDPFDAEPRELTPGVRRALEELRSRDDQDPLSLTSGELHDLESADGAEHWTAGLVVVQRELLGVLVVGSGRRLADGERNAMTALCRETAIALRAVEHTEQQVRQRSEDRFAALIDNSSDIVAVLGSGLDVLYVSPVARRLLGYALEHLEDVDVLSLVHPDDAEMAATMLSDVRFGVRESVELRLRHLDGEFRWFEVVGVDLSSDPNIGGLVLNLREITDRKEAEERLVLSEARFKALVQNSTDLVVVLEPSGVVRYASPSVDQALGVEPESLLGRAISEVFRDSDVDWTQQLSDGAPSTRGAPALFEFTFRNGIDDWRTIETSITDLRGEAAVGGFVLNARDVTDRKGMEQRLRYQATHDELTGLANRVQALDELDGMLRRNSGSTTVAAILIGLDDFKDVNDSLGHGFGDRLLNSVAERITGLLGFGDVAARVGGDEFVVVLERAHGENHVTDLAEQVLSAISLPYDIDGRELTISASAGIVFDHDRTNTGEILLRNADIAMYRAKTQGKRQVVVFETHMHTASADRLELRADLARAITSEQFVAHYQPVVDIETRRIVGAEALIRWEHPQRGLVGPGLFIPLAEESGMIGALGEWILERACTDLAHWRADYGAPMDDFTISVNLSVQQLHDDLIVTTVRDILARAGLPAERLVLEVTESTLITETDKIRATMQELRALGSRLAVDDFGTGYSSLGYIQQFEFDVLKIDKSFVDGLETGTNRQIVAAVLDLARELGVRTIAEGIETEVQDGVLRELGCRYGQGYLYSRPVAESAFRELLAQERANAGGHVSL
jgi:diguanylate cyclase (GGDEF)-like protein/PAS domain S-box-containing protein